MAVDALFAMLAYVLAADVADGAVAIGLRFCAREGMKRIGEDAAVLIDIDAQGSVDGVSAVVGRARGMGGLLGRGRGRGRKAEKKEMKRLPEFHGQRIAPESLALEPQQCL